jgi:hypothetical protein
MTSFSAWMSWLVRQMSKAHEHVPANYIKPGNTGFSLSVRLPAAASSMRRQT